MSQRPDPLWQPDERSDADLIRMETLLSRYRHAEPEHPSWQVAAPTAHRAWRTPVRVATAALLLVAAGLAAWLPWRLAWSDGEPWTVQADSESRETALPVGGHLVTAAGEHAIVRVARIGTVDMSPDTRMTLLETRQGHHRVALESGHIRARIWAPPGYFGVLDGAAEVVDLGCEFDLWKTTDGSGRLSVNSGWVMHAVSGRETLVPAGYAITFSETRAGIPIRPDASHEFSTAIALLDGAMVDGHRDMPTEQLVARFAASSDIHSVLSLLTRHPALASGPLYPRLAVMLGQSPDDVHHREAWAAGSAHAINAWWDLVPRPPKQWWRNWRDALF